MNSTPTAALDTGPLPAAAAASKRPLAGLAGIFLAAMMAGLNSRVGALALVDLRGALGFDADAASWLSTAYAAGELIAMPFAAWFALTLSMRRFELWMLGLCVALAAVLPFVRDLQLLLVLRFTQGIAGGALIPPLMMAALKFLPPRIRLHGLALYAMTATFAPNVAIGLAGYWVDGWHDWRWLYWQIVPLAAVAAALVGWGLPREPIQRARFREANWPSMACGVIALGLIALALDQGVRLDWFESRLVTAAFVVGGAFLAVYLLSEWYHPAPFIKLQILGRRNLLLGFVAFVVLLVVLMSGTLLPASQLGPLQQYRALQLAPTGLAIALPQLVLGFCVALLLYRKWADPRGVFALGLVLIALACFSGAGVNANWHRDQYALTQTLHAFGQPLAIVSMLFLITGVVQPQEGPYVSGAINTLRAFGSILGAALTTQLMAVRGRFHAEALLDQAALRANVVPQALDAGALASGIGQQAAVLAVADAYRVLGLLALLLIPLVLQMNRVNPP
ncbi:MAG: MFS transporter, partial [Pseudomonadota bacterium]|nr:MFS transporter [Pseudomonadota bacterium]